MGERHSASPWCPRGLSNPGWPGSPGGRALASLLIGEAELFSGHLQDSRRWLESAAGLFRTAGADSARALALVRLAENATASGDMVRAMEVLRETRSLAERTELAPHLVTRVLAAEVQVSGGGDRQLSTLEDAQRQLRPGEVCGPCSIQFRITATIAFARAGEVDRARRCLADAESLAGMWQGGPWRAAIWEARAELQHAEGNSGQAAALLREAASLFTECGRPGDGNRCRDAAAELTATNPQHR